MKIFLKIVFHIGKISGIGTHELMQLISQNNFFFRFFYLKIVKMRKNSVNIFKKCISHGKIYGRRIQGSVKLSWQKIFFLVFLLRKIGENGENK